MCSRVAAMARPATEASPLLVEVAAEENALEGMVMARQVIDGRIRAMKAVSKRTREHAAAEAVAEAEEVNRLPTSSTRGALDRLSRSGRLVPKSTPKG